jgi:aspartate racemase
MEGGFYPAVFGRRGITVVVPEAEDRAYVHERYFSELIEGVFKDETRAGMSAVIDRLKARHGIEAVILGGTELPLLFRDTGIETVPLLDTTLIHVESAIARLLA